MRAQTPRENGALTEKRHMDLCVSSVPSGGVFPPTHTHTYLEDAQGFDQAAHLVLQGEHHCCLAGLVCVLLLRVLVDGAEGGPSGLERHSTTFPHCQP